MRQLRQVQALTTSAKTTGSNHYGCRRYPEAARQELIATARRIRQYAGSNPQLREVADQLEQEARRHEEVFSPSMLKH